MNPRLASTTLFCCVLLVTALHGEDRSYDGTGNSSIPLQGVANTPFIRFRYRPQFFGIDGAMPNETQRPNARDISNAVSAQFESTPSARRLSNYMWAWGQFLTHDTDLSTTSNGPAINGEAPIAIHLPHDPLGPTPMPFTRANFVTSLIDTARTPVNEVTSYIDGSAIYGSDALRAAALRTGGGTGAKLLTDANNLLPRNTADLPIENNGPLPNTDMFLAGDIRSNENSLLTSLHTVFAREHNRLVDRITDQMPHLNDEQQYQLARKLVGAQIQAVTYREFLPALLGNGPNVPKAEQYVYNPQLQATVTTAFSNAAFRFGHSAVTSQLNLVDNANSSAGALELRDVFFNPHLIGNDPAMIDKLLLGAATQLSEEVDTLVVDDLRNFLFGPPGAGGLDLAALNIQRARDAGLPNPTILSRAYNFPPVLSFSQLTSNPLLADTLAGIYGSIGAIDTWVAGLAQDHAPGASVGPIFKAIIENQFSRLRDGDRLFYRGNAAGLYTGGVLNPEIAAIIDLDNLTLAQIIQANTSIEHFQSNLFFVPVEGDFNGDGIVDSADYVVWRKAYGTGNVWADANRDGMVGEQDLAAWNSNYGVGISQAGSGLAEIPEPATAAMLLIALLMMQLKSRRQ
jgi:hypothetical protein